ncbi:MAG: MmgE/PrpD family protein [Betaproteobacteria bacterium]|nr:MmgE/PrpD family protein [Betaproteobacteria bacterium]
MRSTTDIRGRQLTAFIAGTAQREHPPAVMEAASRALVDFIGCAVGASDDAPARPVRQAIKSWNASGKARIICGGRTTPALAALANGTMAHAMDYDDTHPMGAGHPSGPCWSTALALAEEHGCSEREAIAAFITGFEVMAKLGGGGPPGVGRSLQRRGFHPTSVFGRAGAAAVACVLMKLDEQQTAYALGVAATTAGGLVGSFGTHGKPFHAGKAAMDGILAAQLAAGGFVSATHLYGLEKGLLDAFIQNREVEVPPLDDFDHKWEILGNSFKPFASCRATHASTQAARSLADRVKGRKIAAVHAKVHPNALVTAGKLAPRTPLEGKFSVPFCIALGLRGYRVVATDFTDATMRDPAVMEVVPAVKLDAVQGQAPHSAYLDVILEGGERLRAQTDVVMGHPDNPMSRDALRAKFEGLVEPVLGRDKTADLYETACRFARPGSLEKLSSLLAGKALEK